MTHKLITIKILRRAFARELWQARQARILGKEAWVNIRWGIESGIWAVQKEMMQ